MRSPLWISAGLILALSGALGAQSAAPTGDRFALVVGNGAYTANRLVNPPNDADDMAVALAEAGFAVTKVKDVNLAGFENALSRFEQQIRPGSTALFYYAGHGVQVQGQNLLLPVGETINTEAQARSRAISVDDVLDRFRRAGASTGLLWLDACRDNPFPGASRSGTRGLTVIQAPPQLETFIAFAADAGATAADGSGRNGVFTAALLKQLKEPGLEINDLFTRVKAEVAQVSGNQQRPRTDSGLTRPLVLLDAAEVVRRARAASDAKAAEVAALEAQIAQRQAAIANARDAAARQALEVEQQRQQALLAAQRLEAQNLAREAERQRAAAEAARAGEAQRQADAQAQAARQRELEAVAAQRRAEAERLQTQTNDPAALIAAFEAAAQAVADVETRFAQAWTATQAEVNRSFDQRLATLNAQAKEPWESQAEFTTRLGQERTALEGERAQALRTAETEHGRQRQTQSAALIRARDEARTRLEVASFSLAGSRLTVSPGAFDGETKRWPVTLASSDPIAAFSLTVELDFSREASLRTVYQAWDTAFKANGVAAEAAWGLQRQGPAYAMRLKSLALLRLTDNLRQPQTVPADPVRFAMLNERGQMVNVQPARVNFAAVSAGALFLEGAKLTDLAEGGTFSMTSVDFRPLAFETRYGNGHIETVTVTPRAGQTVPAAFTYRPPLLDLVRVEGGTFQMGSPTGGDNNERPVRAVTVRTFQMSRTEVTQAQYLTVMGANPSNFKSGPDAPNRPVENVTWFDAVNFCNRLSQRDGLTSVYTINGTTVTANWSANGYRLPTEAEWEYAARGGRQSRNFTYAGGNDAAAVSWLGSNSNSSTQPVGRKTANELGLFDMSGNVWEWVWDWYGNYGSAAESDPRGASSGTRRVIRGGSWINDVGNLRSAYRYNTFAEGRGSGIGFRVVRP